MTTTIVDLRSDTVTQPTPGMRAAMAAAPLGDDVFGDDPSVNALQEQIAGMLGFEAALFVPTGTQSNLCAILSHCQRGDEYIVGQMQHCYRWEGGGAAVFGSVQPQPLEHQSDGTLALADIEAAVKPDDPHFARSRLLALENTLGGKLLPMTYIEQATQLAKRLGLGRHLDGARLFNAAVAQAAATGADPRSEARRMAQCFDSVSVCFSKGLGAPVGSALCGSRDYIARARRVRKMAGGAMRQSGMLAAAASYALEHQVERLAEDHALARRLAEGLAGMDGISSPGWIAQPTEGRLDPNRVATNFVFFKVRGDPKAFVAALEARGVRMLDYSHGWVRAVTHYGIDAADIERTIDACAAVLKETATPSATPPVTTASLER